MIKITLIVIILAYSILPTVYLRLKWLKLFKTDKKRIILSFDDGPSEPYTLELLELLKKFNIRASFFLVTDFIGGREDLVRRMIEDGHLIGLHSINHGCSLFKGISSSRKDILDSIEALELLGIEAKYYRPPWGIFNLSTVYILRKNSLKLVLWNVMAEDWRGNISSLEIENRILRRSKKGSTLCLHDGRGKNQAPSRTIKALESCIPKFLDEGYEFVRIDEYY